MVASRRRRLLGLVAVCIVAMAALTAMAFAWLEVTWVRVALLVVWIACLSGVLYAWWLARRIDKLLLTRPDAGDGHEQGHS